MQGVAIKATNDVFKTQIDTYFTINSLLALQMNLHEYNIPLVRWSPRWKKRPKTDDISTIWKTLDLNPVRFKKAAQTHFANGKKIF